jgi:hypothetical protein
MLYRLLRVTGLLVVVVSFSTPFARDCSNVEDDDDTQTPILMDDLGRN